MKYPEGYFVNIWMTSGIALGLPIGLVIGIIIGNPGLFGMGLPIGLAVGLAIGQSIESKYKKEGKIRPLTKRELKKRRNLSIIGFILFLLGITVGLLAFFLLR